ncbi:UNVERIFIED_CONTAM: hypothetical protein GTU68_019340, partial [Idotea baltica]|nr:hypothetical protein [Idotea baltica]
RRLTTFEQLGLSPEILEALNGLGFENPTEIQEKAIPQLLQDATDCIGIAQTGTGKTAAFGLPLLDCIIPENKHTQGLILAPTRELCMQIADQIKQFSKHLPKISALPVYGGASIVNQIKDLRKPQHIIIATPGRLRDLIRRKSVNLSKLQYIVLDEADEMLNMGFKEELDDILSFVPEEKNTWLFSATMPPANVAARGIDVNDLTHVFHYALPDDDAYYTHRSGRTARAGKKGVSVSFVSGKEVYKIRGLEKQLGIEFTKVLIPKNDEILEKRIENWCEYINNKSISEKISADLITKVNILLGDLTKEELTAKLLMVEIERLNLGSSTDLNDEESSSRGGGGRRRDRGGRGGYDRRGGGGRGRRSSSRSYSRDGRSGGGKKRRSSDSSSSRPSNFKSKGKPKSDGGGGFYGGKRKTNPKKK